MADEHGLVQLGGRLSPDWLLDAYRHGIFPWPIFDDPKIMAWWSPDPRAILELDGLYVSKRLARTCRTGRFQITIDQDFVGVLHGCATAQDRQGNTWLTDEMIDAYCVLHRLGYSHSVEVWHEGQLAGGTYGVALGALFAGESMFYRVRDASKVALVHLVAHLTARGYQLFDLQQLNPHTESLGGTEISRRKYLSRLAKAVKVSVTFGSHLESAPAIRDTE
jgi:leucyl/phenylalanyl-tRNA--protein transferase